MVSAQNTGSRNLLMAIDEKAKRDLHDKVAPRQIF